MAAAGERRHHSTLPVHLWCTRTGLTAIPIWTSAGPFHRLLHLYPTPPPHCIWLPPPLHGKQNPSTRSKDRLNECLSPSGDCWLDRIQGLLFRSGEAPPLHPSRDWLVSAEHPRIASEHSAVLASAPLDAAPRGPLRRSWPTYCSPHPLYSPAATAVVGKVGAWTSPSATFEGGSRMFSEKFPMRILIQAQHSWHFPCECSNPCWTAAWNIFSSHFFTPCRCSKSNPKQCMVKKGGLLAGALQTARCGRQVRQKRAGVQPRLAHDHSGHEGNQDACFRPISAKARWRKQASQSDRSLKRNRAHPGTPLRDDIETGSRHEIAGWITRGRLSTG